MTIDCFNYPVPVVITYDGDYNTGLVAYIVRTLGGDALTGNPFTFDVSEDPPMLVVPAEAFAYATYTATIVHTNASGRFEELARYSFKYNAPQGSNHYTALIERRDIVAAIINDPDTSNTHSIRTGERSIQLVDKGVLQKEWHWLNTQIAAIEASAAQGGGIPTIDI